MTQTTTGAEEGIRTAEGQETAWYMVREGETLEDIADDFGMTPGILAQMNDMDPEVEEPTPGVLLKVPVPENMVGNPARRRFTLDGEESGGNTETYQNGVKVRADGKLEGLTDLQRARMARLDFEARWHNATAENPYLRSTFDERMIRCLAGIRQEVIDGTIPDDVRE